MVDIESSEIPRLSTKDQRRVVGRGDYNEYKGFQPRGYEKPKPPKDVYYCYYNNATTDTTGSNDNVNRLFSIATTATTKLIKVKKQAGPLQ